MPSKKVFGYLAREGTAIAMAVYAGWIAFGGPQAPTNGLWSMFWVAILMGTYTWIQDLGMATDKHMNPGRGMLDTFTSGIPLAISAYALIQNARGADPLAEYNFMVLVLILVFTAKDVIVGLYHLLRYLFLSDDVKITNVK